MHPGSICWPGVRAGQSQKIGFGGEQHQGVDSQNRGHDSLEREQPILGNIGNVCGGSFPRCGGDRDAFRALSTFATHGSLVQTQVTERSITGGATESGFAVIVLGTYRHGVPVLSRFPTA